MTTYAGANARAVWTLLSRESGARPLEWLHFSSCDPHSVCDSCTNFFRCALLKGVLFNLKMKTHYSGVASAIVSVIRSPRPPILTYKPDSDTQWGNRGKLFWGYFFYPYPVTKVKSDTVCIMIPVLDRSVVEWPRLSLLCARVIRASKQQGH